MTLAALQAEIRATNIEKGWRPADGGPGTNTYGDYVALLHSEISEALEAFRSWGVADATAGYNQELERPAKPEGFGSELADVVIRLIDMCDVFGVPLFDMDMQLADVEPVRPEVDDWAWVEELKTVGDWLAWLHLRANEIWLVRSRTPYMLRAVVAVAERWGVSLTAEVERKIAYNRTRAFQHGGRAL